jgi:hypothetical protein
VAVVWLATLALLEKRAFWVIDNASKFLQVEAVLASGYRDTSIDWSGREIDPEYRWNPLPHGFGVVEGGRLYSFYPPAFAVLASLPYRLLGRPGLYALPFVAGVALLAGIATAARTLGADARGQSAAVLLAGLCTPIWFYSVVFWEHVPAACLAVWGSEGVLRFLRDGARRDLVRGCALAALAVYLRDELYLFCAVLVAVAVTLGPRPRARTAATALLVLTAALLPLWIFQFLALGNPLGFHLAADNAPDLATHLRERGVILHLLFLASSPDRLASLLAMGPLALALVLAPRLSGRAATWFPPALAAFATLACGASLAGYAWAESPIRWMHASNGLLATVPALAFAGFRFADPREAALDLRATGALRSVALSYAGVYALAAPLGPSSGVHWGNRFLLVLYPLLALLAGPNLARWLERHAPGRPLAASVVAFAIVTSLGAQVFGVRLLHAKQSFSTRLAAEVARHPDVPLATSIFWLPAELLAEFPARPIFAVFTQDELRELRGRLYRTGHRQLLFAVPIGKANAGTLIGRVEDPDLRFFGVDLVRVELP